MRRPDRRLLLRGPHHHRAQRDHHERDEPDTPTGKPAGAHRRRPTTASTTRPTPPTCACRRPGRLGGLPANGVIYVEHCTNQATCTTTVATRGRDQPAVERRRDGGLARTNGGRRHRPGVAQLSRHHRDGQQHRHRRQPLLHRHHVERQVRAPTRPAAPSTDVLGLVADNYVEINHPVSGGNNASRAGRARTRAPTLAGPSPATSRTPSSTP